MVYGIFDDLSMNMFPLLEIDNINNKGKPINFLNYFYSNRKFLAFLFERPGFKKKLHMILKDSIVIKAEGKSAVTTETTLSMDVLASSILGIIMWWLKDGNHFSSEYIANQIVELYQ